MFQKFVYVTGALDFLIGLGLWFQTASQVRDEHFVSGMTLGTFLMMAAACLMWASKDLAQRAPVVFWQALVRLTAVFSVLYAVPAGLAPANQYGLVVFDGGIAVIYIIGISRVTGCSLLELLRCAPAKTSAA